MKLKPWKLQKFAGDVVYDLRNRGLLPVVILLAVGMVAVPFLITRGGSEPAPPPPAPVAGSELAPENQPAVLAYNPGIRDYKRRLAALASKDPFRQQFTTPPAAATLDQSIPSETAPGASLNTDTGPSGGESTPSSGGSGGGKGGGKKSKTRYFYYETEIEMGDASAEPEQFDKVRPFDYLPSAETPVLVFLGNQSDKRAVFMVSEEVTGNQGSGSCFPSPDACQLLTLERGDSHELVFGPDGKTYRVKVTGVKLKVSSKPPKG